MTLELNKYPAESFPKQFTHLKLLEQSGLSLFPSQRSNTGDFDSNTGDLGSNTGDLNIESAELPNNQHIKALKTTTAGLFWLKQQGINLND